jgi:hypothetical protein
MHATSNDKVLIELTSDEALVLFDFLTRFCDTDVLTLEDQAESRALWDLLALLEKQLVEPFRSDYSELLHQARERLRDKVE